MQVSEPMREPTIAARVRAGYLARGFNRYQFAAQLGIAYSTLQRAEAGGDFTLQVLMRISLLLDVSMDDLCFGRDGRARAREQVDLSQVLGVPEVRAFLARKRATRVQVQVVLAAIKRLYRPVTLDWLEAFWSEFRAQPSLTVAADTANAKAIVAEYERSQQLRGQRQSAGFANRGKRMVLVAVGAGEGIEPASRTRKRPRGKDSAPR